MSRFTRLLLALLTLLSLILLLSACVLWVRSYYLSDGVWWETNGGSRMIRSATGDLAIELFIVDWSHLANPWTSLKYVRDQAYPAQNRLVFGMPDPGDTWVSWQHAGFGYYHQRNVGRGTLAASIIVPFWSIELLSAILPLAWTTTRLRSRLRNRRLQRGGLCLHCGYDLRATPQGNACPECGSATAKGS